MNEVSDRELLRLLAGELPAGEAERLERRLAADPELARRYEEWQRLWRSIELPAPPEPRQGRSVLPAVRRRLESEALGRRAAGRLPGRVLAGRVLAAAALSAGVALGVWLGASTLGDASAGRLGSFEPSLAESYWSGIEGGDLGSGDDAPEEEDAGGSDAGETSLGETEERR